MIVGCIEENKVNGFYKIMGGKFIKKWEFRLLNQNWFDYSK